MSLYPRAITEFLALAGIPRGPLSKIYIVDPANGDNAALGDRFTKPLKTLAAAYAKCTADQNDTVLFVGGPTADSPTAAITWAKSYTHLVGLSGDLPGMGQRCRVVNSAANDLAVLFTLSGSGCIVQNMQFFDGKDKNEDGACLLVSGSRNYLKNVFVAGMGHATPAARAGSYSLKLTGAENAFEDCAIGLDTIARAAANGELVVDGAGAARNIFRRCRFLSASEEATKVLVKIANMDRWVEFEDCIFQNFSVNWAVSLTNAFAVSAAATHQVVLRGLNQLVGVTGWADTVTRVYSAAPASNAGFGVVVNPTT